MAKEKQKKRKGHPRDSSGDADDSSKDDLHKEVDLRRRQRQVSDPDGTLDIARSTDSAKNEEQLLKKSETPQAQHHLWGNQGDLAKRRLESLRQDDINPNMEQLSDKQKRAFQKRRGRENKIVQARIQRNQNKRLQAAVAAADATQLFSDEAGLLEPEHDMERTTAVTQVQLAKHIVDDPATKRQIYNLDLVDTAPYGLAYDRSGRYSILYSKSAQGHLAVMDCHQRSLQTEFYVHERVQDSCFLHNFTLFAAAQLQHVFIYDSHSGAEVHRLEDHTRPLALQFLPYHWLLASIGQSGYLKYQDTSTGQLVTNYRTQLGPCRVLRQNPANAVLHAGHSNGTVTLWSPASTKYLVKMHCHKGAAVHSLALDPTGKLMVTGGADGQVKVWDVRMYRELHAYYTRPGIPTSMDISQRGILGIGHAGHATFWPVNALSEKVRDPYMHHGMPRCGPVETLRFRPYEDVCGIGHARGISSIVIPGSGEPNLDTSEYDTNPMQDTKQRRETEVRSLLDKLSPDMICLEADQVAGVEESDPHKRLERVRDLQEAANEAKLLSGKKKKQKSKKRGRSKIQTQLRRKKATILDQNTLKLREVREKVVAAAEAERVGTRAPEMPKDCAPAALKRFF